VGKQFAEFLPLLSPSGQSGVTLKQEAEIVPQSAVERILERKG
jgi:hypothetical protein